MTSSKPKLLPKFIHPDAFEITENLQQAGFETYLVGGCVRDLLAGIQPKDFDIATTAHPRQVKKTIFDAYIIGKRFRLVLVKRGRDLFEVATFRRDARPEDLNEEDKTAADNLFGTPEEDARRRDFTLNAVFYDPVKDKLIDFCGGLEDIKSHTVRMIGDPQIRLKEDPIRILRALRFSHKLDYKIETSLRAAMKELSETLKTSVLPRRREEMLKLLRLKEPTLALMEAHDLGVLEHIFPTLDEVYRDARALEDFNGYMSRIHNFVLDAENPVELFGYLMFAFYRSMVTADPFHKVYSQDFLKDERIKNFMHWELGMYNIEQAMVAKAIEFQARLKKIDKPKTDYGHLNEAIPLGLMMAKADFVLPAEKLLEWESSLHLFETKVEKSGGFKRRKRFKKNFDKPENKE